MDSEVMTFLDRLRDKAGDCSCLGCNGLREWANLVESRQPETLDDLPVEGIQALEENCDCEGCRYSRYLLVLGNPEPKC